MGRSVNRHPRLTVINLARRHSDRWEGAEVTRRTQDESVAAIVAQAVAESGASGPKAMGAVMKLAMEKAQGQVDGRRLTEFVKKALAGPA